MLYNTDRLERAPRQPFGWWRRQWKDCHWLNDARLWISGKEGGNWVPAARQVIDCSHLLLFNCQLSCTRLQSCYTLLHRCLLKVSSTERTFHCSRNHSDLRKNRQETDAPLLVRVVGQLARCRLLDDWKVNMSEFEYINSLGQWSCGLHQSLFSVQQYPYTAV